MKTKYWAIGLAVVLVVGMVACSQQASQEPQEPAQTVQTAQQTEPVTTEPTAQPVEVKQEVTPITTPTTPADGEQDPENVIDPTDPADPVDPVDPTDPAREPEPVVELFTEVNEVVYATQQVNIRESWSLDSEKQGSLSKGNSITRTGVGIAGTEAEGWDRVQLSDGTTAYIVSKYLSTTKPSVQSTNNGGGGTTQTPATQQPSSGGKDIYGGFNTYEEYIADIQRQLPGVSIEQIKKDFPDQATGYVDEALLQQDIKDGRMHGAN